MDLTPAEVVGHTCYHFVHVEDLENLRQSHEDCELYPCESIVYEMCPLPPYSTHCVGEPVQLSSCPVVIGALCCHHHELPNHWQASFLFFFPSILLYILSFHLPLVSSQCWGKARWWQVTIVGSRGEEATCGSSPLPRSPLITKLPMNATSSGSTTFWGRYHHSRARVWIPGLVYVLHTMQAPYCEQGSFEGTDDEIQRNYGKSFTPSNIWKKTEDTFKIVTSKQSTLSELIKVSSYFTFLYKYWR